MFSQCFFIIMTFVVSLEVFGAELECAPNRVFSSVSGYMMMGRRPMTFRIDDDQAKFVRRKRNSRNLEEEHNFVVKLKEALSANQRQEVLLSEAPKIANGIFANEHDLWGRILEAVRLEKDIDVRFVEGCFFLKEAGATTPQPTDRIEQAMLRIFIDNPATLKRDLVLMLYEAGYRDYAYEDIIAKSHALLGSGFCQPGQMIAYARTEEFVVRLRSFWEQVRLLGKNDILTCYLNVARADAWVYFHMIHMKENSIMWMLQKDLYSNYSFVCGLAHVRRERILRYLTERAETPCREKEVLSCVQGVLLPPRGVAFEIAALVFEGKAKIVWDSAKKTFMFTRNGTDLTRPDGILDELAFFHNLYEYKTLGEAVLATYQQGFRLYTPERLLMIKKGVDLVGYGSTTPVPMQVALRHFLEIHAQDLLPPVWFWNQELSSQGRGFLTLCVHKDLNALIDLHNRRALKVIQSYVESFGRVYRSHQGLYTEAAKNRLSRWPCKMTQLVDAMKDAGCSQQCSYEVLYTTVQDFYEHISYSIPDDNLVWLERAQVRPEMSQFQQWEAVCFLRNRYPSMGLLDVGFSLMCQGVFLRRDRMRVIFHAVDVAGLLVTPHSILPYANDCKVFFDALKQSAQSPDKFLRIGKTLNGVTLCRRRKSIVLEALELTKNQKLYAFVEKIGAVTKGRFAFVLYDEGKGKLCGGKKLNPGTSREETPEAQKRKKE